MKTSLSDIIAMFKQLNEDCLESGETAAEFSDTVYYSEQVQNIYDCSEDMADQIASDMADFDEYFEFETYYDL